MQKLTVTEQAIEAVRCIDALFDDSMPPVPENATIQLLWAELCRLKGKVKKPKKVEAIKLVLENPQLDGLNVDIIADIIRKVFARHGMKCKTTAESIRWYISQKTLDWNLVPRNKKPYETTLY